MSEFNISIHGGESKRLKTGGKYCPADILVTAQRGFIQPDDEYLTPEFVYATTRPAGWLPMPRPTDYECYCLGYILPGITAHFNLTVTFTGTCVVEFGSLLNGVFVAKESYSPTSGVFFSKTLNYNDYGDELPDGKRQYMTRIYGNAIARLKFMREGTAPNCMVVDIMCGIPLEVCQIANYNETKNFQSLRYLNFVGKGKPGWINGNEFIGGCNTLLSVGCEAENTSDYATYSCFGTGLIAISPKLFSKVTNAINNIFSESCIQYVKMGNAKPTNTSNAFASSRLNIFNAETVDTSLTTEMAYMFQNSQALYSVTDLNIASVANVTNMFQYCRSIDRLTFAGDTTPGGWTIDLTYTALGHDALVEMINSLPTATTAATITITNNPGASQLTDAEIAVATAKNWTVTI